MNAMRQRRELRTPASADVRTTTPAEKPRPRATWRPVPKVRPCLVCNKPRISTGAQDRVHPACRPEGERAGLVR
jgi:hypothetical protein